MGLNESANATYLNIRDGKLSKRVKEPTEKSVSRTLESGKVIHEEIFKSITGFLKDIKVTEHPEYGKFWNIYVEDGGEVFIVQTNYSGRYAASFLKALPNVDFRQQVTLAPWSKVKDGKTKSSLYIKHGDDTIEWFFTPDDPKGLPTMVKIKRKGKEEWDDTEMMEFFEKYVNENILPKIKSSARIEPTKKEDGWDKLKEIAKKNEQPASIDDVADDLPF